MSGQGTPRSPYSQQNDDSDDEMYITENQPLDQVLQQPRPNLQGPFRDTLRSNTIDQLAAGFPQPPQGYTFRNTGSSDPVKSRQTQELLSQFNKASNRPTTREGFDAKGSIVQPPNGDNVKRDGADRCLTCIQQGGSCHGTNVQNGRCHNCTGGDSQTMASGEVKYSRKHRDCRWKEPDNNIYTYEDHIKHYPTKRRLPQNTKLGVFQRSMTAGNLWPTILDIPRQTYEGQLLRWVARHAVDAGDVQADAARNLDNMIQIAATAMAYVGSASNIANPQTREQVRAAMNEIYLRLMLWHEQRRGISAHEMRDLLPYGHPRKQG